MSSNLWHGRCNWRMISMYDSVNSRTRWNGENGWWEEKHKRRADLITLICKLSGKRCNQIIRILSDNWEKDIICNNYYIIYIWQKQIIFHSDYETGFRLTFLNVEDTSSMHFLRILSNNVIVHSPYIFRETLRRFESCYAIFSHRPHSSRIFT